MPARLRDAQPLQFRKIPTQAPLIGRRIQPCMNLPQRQGLAGRLKEAQNPALPFVQALDSVTDSCCGVRDRHRFTAHPVRTETNRDAAAIVVNLQGRQSCRRLFRHLQRPAPPLLDDASQIEHSCDQWVPRLGLVGPK